MLLIRGFISSETQGSRIFNNNVCEKVRNHLQSTLTETILSKPMFAGTIAQVSPQLTPISPFRTFPNPEVQAQFNLPESRSWRKLQSNFGIVNILPGKCAWAPRRGGGKRFEMAGGFSVTLWRSLTAPSPCFEADRSRLKKRGSFGDIIGKRELQARKLFKTAHFSSRYFQTFSLHPTLMTTPYERQTSSRCVGEFTVVFFLCRW